MEQVYASLPVVRSSDEEAVILIASTVVLHSGVNDSADWHIDVITAQLLHILHHLIPCRLEELTVSVYFIKVWALFY